jgi:lantibiotic modifying enzyme
MDEVRNKIEQIISVLEEVKTSEIGLFTGDCGIALFSGYVGNIIGRSELDLVIGNILQNCFNKIESYGANHTFSSGFSGLCWTVNTLVRKGKIDADVNTLFEDIYPNILENSYNDIKHNYFDFMHGGLGASVYFLENFNDKQSKQYILDVINRLDNYSIAAEDEVKWMSLGDVVNGEKIYEYNFGLAHGIPSIVWFLCKCYELNIEREKCKKMTYGAINWMLRQKMDCNSVSIFPSAIAISGEKRHSRMGWCYGDLGVASVIWQAGKAFGNIEWSNEALKVMKMACNRKDFKENGIFDAGLCHGTAGIAHIFNRFYFETNETVFRETAEYWLEQTLKFANHENGVAGYKTMRDSFVFENENGLLEGVAGIGLALSGFLTNDINDLDWDRCLLLS